MAKLYFYYAAMNAGKTTMLLQSAYNYQECHLRVLKFIPACDTRFGENILASRIGLSASAISFRPTCNLLDAFLTHRASYAPDRISCVFIDEAQFMTTEQVDQISEIVDQYQVPVMAYGLRTDFQGHLFAGSKRLLELADVLNELHTLCACGRKATMNLRVDAYGNVMIDGNQVEIGGNERYISVCRLHHKEKMNMQNIDVSMQQRALCGS